MFKSFFWSLVIKVFLSLGNFYLAVYVARTLGEEGLAFYSVVIAVVLGLGVISRVGLDGLVLKLGGIAFAEKNFNDFAAFQKAIVLLIFFNCSIVSFFAYSYQEYFFIYLMGELNEDLIFSIIVLFFFCTYLYMYSAFYKAMRMPVVASLQEIGGISVLSIFIILFMSLLSFPISLDFIIYAMIISTAFLMMSSLLYIRYVSNKLFGKADASRRIGLNDLIQMVKSAVDFFIINFLGYFGQWGFLIVTAFFVESKDLGLFSAAFRTVLLINFVLMVMNGILAPRFASLYHEENFKKLKLIAVRATSVISLVSLIPMLAVIIFPEFLIGFLFGEEFSDAAILLVIMAVAQFINVCTGSVGFLLNMTGYQYIVRNVMILVSFISLVFLILYVPVHGVLASAIVFSASLVLQNFIFVYFAYKKLNILMIPSVKLACLKG